MVSWPCVPRHTLLHAPGGLRLPPALGAPSVFCAHPRQYPAEVRCPGQTLSTDLLSNHSGHPPASGALTAFPGSLWLPTITLGCSPQLLKGPLLVLTGLCTGCYLCLDDWHSPSSSEPAPRLAVRPAFLLLGLLLCGLFDLFTSTADPFPLESKSLKAGCVRPGHCCAPCTSKPV